MAYPIEKVSQFAGLTALQKKQVLLEQEVQPPPPSSFFKQVRDLFFTSTPQVLKALHHPHVIAYISHFFHDDALHVRLQLLPQ